MAKNKIKLAIGTPTSGNVRVEYMESVLALQKDLLYNDKLGIQDIKLFYFCSSVIPKNRQVIVKQAKEWGASHILWIDDDMRFPSLAAKALIQSAKNNPMFRIIGANCIKRQYPIEYMATALDGKSEVVSNDKTGIEQVLFTGNAFVLMDMSLFDEVSEPWFSFPFNQATGSYGTEDAYFMLKSGVPVFVDHDVSQLIDHIGYWTFCPEHRKAHETSSD